MRKCLWVAKGCIKMDTKKKKREKWKNDERENVKCRI